MCGRVVQEVRKDLLRQIYAVETMKSIEEYVRYNVAPSSRICIIKSDEGPREARIMRWGLIPSWVKRIEDFKATTFNARAENLLQSKVYATPFKKRRCLIAVDGYYEWKKLSD